MQFLGWRVQGIVIYWMVHYCGMLYYFCAKNRKYSIVLTVAGRLLATPQPTKSRPWGSADKSLERGENVNGKEQNTSDCHRQEYAYELLTAEGSIGDAESDWSPEGLLSLVPDRRHEVCLWRHISNLRLQRSSESGVRGFRTVWRWRQVFDRKV